jgi:Ca2+-transporting ATPase
LIEPGEVLPVDGLFLRGHNVRCDKSTATGASDAVHKAPFEKCWAERNAILEAKSCGENPGELRKGPFLISGSKVIEGVGAYVVIAVGERSFNGQIMTGMCILSPAIWCGIWH